MDHSTHDSPATEGLEARAGAGGTFWVALSRGFRSILVLVILGVGGGASYYWLMNQPKAERRGSRSEATLVSVIPVHSTTNRVIVQAMGTVIPARRIQLAARVSGYVEWAAPRFVPGGHFLEGEEILRIDRKDYDLAVQQRKGELVKAESELRLEMGQQSVAEREYELLGGRADKQDEDLLLRKPQLEATKADISVAQSQLDRARLDLERTTVVCPFNAVLQSRNVDMGSHVSSGTALASLIGTDEYWIEVPVPVDELRWIDIPGPDHEKGSVVRVYDEAAWGPGVFREGRVARLMTDLEPEGRMARLLVTVEDPLELREGASMGRPLLLESFPQLEIEGKEMRDVVEVPRTAVHDGEYAWVMNAENALEVRALTIVWSTKEEVFASTGLGEGDLLVTSDLGAPVPGMPLRTEEASIPTTAGEPSASPEASENVS